jgi:hypothetical protein
MPEHREIAAQPQATDQRDQWRRQWWRRAIERNPLMKYSLMLAAAALTLGLSGLSAQACNPYPQKGKVPTVLPPSMLAKNHPGFRPPDVNNPIVGLWHVVHTDSSGNLLFESFDAWHSDGNELEMANGPPAGGNICVGQWTQNGKSIQLLTHVTWLYDLNNNYQGTFNMTQTNRVTGKGNNYTGTLDIKVYDPNGNLVGEVTGTTTAERLVSQ